MQTGLKRRGNIHLGPFLDKKLHKSFKLKDMKTTIYNRIFWLSILATLVSLSLSTVLAPLLPSRISSPAALPPALPQAPEIAAGAATLQSIITSLTIVGLIGVAIVFFLALMGTLYGFYHLHTYKRQGKTEIWRLETGLNALLSLSVLGLMLILVSYVLYEFLKPVGFFYQPTSSTTTTNSNAVAITFSLVLCASVYSLTFWFLSRRTPLFFILVGIFSVAVTILVAGILSPLGTLGLLGMNIILIISSILAGVTTMLISPYLRRKYSTNVLAPIDKKAHLLPLWQVVLITIVTMWLVVGGLLVF